jgi:hypothetical protein
MSFKLITTKKELWLTNIKQAIQGLFTAGTSIIHRSFSEGGMKQKKRSAANGDRVPVQLCTWNVPITLQAQTEQP